MLGPGQQKPNITDHITENENEESTCQRIKQSIDSKFNQLNEELFQMIRFSIEIKFKKP